MAEDLNQSALYKIMTWLSPSFPVGSYSYSHGIEYAFECGKVTDAPRLTRWIEGILRFGSGRVDADLFKHAWHAADQRQEKRLQDLIALGQALRPTAEMALESQAQGRAFYQTLAAIDPSLCLKDLEKAVYPLIVAIAAAGHAIPLKMALSAFLHAVIANLVSAGTRLIPLGQTDSQRCLIALEPALHQAVHACLAREAEDDFGAATFMVDWTSMKHETQYTRLFRS